MAIALVPNRDTTYDYGHIGDPADLRIVVRELSRIRGWLDQFADIAAETPDVSAERAAGVRAATSLVSRLRELAVARLDVMAPRPSQAVVVVDPGRLPPGVELSVGVSELSMVSGPTVASEGISSAVVTLRPGYASAPRCYPDDVVVMGVMGRVCVIWWNEKGVKHQVDSPRLHHTRIHRGTRHSIYNAGLLPAAAAQFRASADMTTRVTWMADDSVQQIHHHNTQPVAIAADEGNLR